MRMFTCLIFILTHSVLANAAPQQWVPTFAGQTEVDGVPVVAMLEQTTPANVNDVPSSLAGVFNQQPSPSLLPEVQSDFRLDLAVEHNSAARAIYNVNPQNVSLDGDLRNAFVSRANDPRGFQFVATPEADGTIRVQYVRHATGGKVLTGEFTLAPVPHIL